MQSIQNTLETHKRSFISAFLIYMTVPSSAACYVEALSYRDTLHFVYLISVDMSTFGSIFVLFMRCIFTLSFSFHYSQSHTRFFISNTFIGNARLKMTSN